MTLIELLSELHDGRFNEGDILESDEGINFVIGPAGKLTAIIAGVSYPMGELVNQRTIPKSTNN